MRIQRILLALVLAAAVAPSVSAAQRTGRMIVVRRGWLGISYESKAEIIDGRPTDTQITVQDVVEGSPADKAGVRVGDQIVRIDGKAVSASKFEDLARTMEPGDTMRLRLLTNGRERDVTIVATDRPAQFSGQLRLFRGDSGFVQLDSIRAMTRIFMDSARLHMFKFGDDSLFIRGFPRMREEWFDSVGGRRFLFTDSLPGHFRFEIAPLSAEFREGFPRFDMLIDRSGVAGAEFTELNPGLAQYFGTDKGLLVLRVGPGTPAALAGIEAGDVVTRANGRAIEDIEDLRVTVAGARDASIRIDVLRKGKSRALQLDVKRRRD